MFDYAGRNICRIHTLRLLRWVTVRWQDVLGSISEQLRHGTRWRWMGIAAKVS